MSRVLFFAVLSITSAALADETLWGDVPHSCKPLVNLTEGYKLEGSAFINDAKSCSLLPIQEKENLTNYAETTMDIIKAISKYECSFEETTVKDSGILDKLVKCVVNNGFDKFNEKEAKTHFTMNGTVYLIFGIKQCIKSQKIFDCVNDEFSAKKNTPGLKKCKDSIFDGFEITSERCNKDAEPEFNGVKNYLPSYLLVSTTFMIVKFAVLSGF